jgi:bifunctional DNase/RNase
MVLSVGTTLADADLLRHADTTRTDTAGT